MTQEKIIEGNDIIAQFMGEDITAYAYNLFGPDNYGADWSKLMPVVEKIEKLGYDSVIAGDVPNSHSCYFSEGTPQGDGGKYFTIRSEAEAITTKIEAVWLAVVEFVKFYNQKP